MQPRHSRGVPDYIGTERAKRTTTTGGGRTERAKRTQSRPHPARKGAASPQRAARGREESRSRPAEATGRRHAPRPPLPYLDTIATTQGIESAENRLFSAFSYAVHTEFINRGLAKKTPIWYNRGVKTTVPNRGSFRPHTRTEVYLYDTTNRRPCQAVF